MLRMSDCNDYSDLSDEELKGLYDDLKGEIQSYSKDDLQDPALYYEYMGKCGELDDVQMEAYRRHV